ncbi:MAG: PKD domain-containing protein, partial [Campylobacterales bacterium]|nr:PKD domain-containing protein [Campylobacterales bacterium]
MHHFKILLLSLFFVLFNGCEDKQTSSSTPTMENNESIVDKNTTIDDSNTTDDNNQSQNDSPDSNTTQTNTTDNNESNVTDTLDNNSTDSNTSQTNTTDSNTSDTNETHLPQLPLLSVNAGEDKTARIGELVVLTAKVESNESNLSFRWHEDNKTIGTGQYLSISNLSVGEHNISITVTHNETNRTATASVIITIENRLIIEDRVLQERNGWQSVIHTNRLVVNQKSATVEYLKYNCGGNLIYLNPQTNGYLFDEELTFGLEYCRAGCQVILSQDGSSYQKFCNYALVTEGKLSTPLDIELYEKIAIKEPSAGMDNNATHILYATQSGILYAMDIEDYNSTAIANLTDNYLVNGLAYYQDELYYYSYTIPATTQSYTSYHIESVDLNTTVVTPQTATRFPDGLDIYNDKIYSVTYDVSGELSIFDLNGSYLDALETGIDDIVGIAHTQYYLYILSEDGDIYQTNPYTGE